MSKSIRTILIDESGTLPDPRDRFIVVCGVVVEELKQAENIISRILKSLRQRKIGLKELKFYHAGQNTKRQFLSGVVAADLKIFALAVDKRNRKITDNHENFAILVFCLINEVNLWYKDEKINIVIDRHFHKKTDQEKFNKILKDQIQDKNFQIRHVDSQSNQLINIADMVAGSILWKYTGKDIQFYNLIKDNIVSEKMVNWPEIKRKKLNRF